VVVYDGHVNANKNRTAPLKAKDYVSDAGQLNLTRMTDDALAAFESIRATGVGRQQNRSRGVIFRSYRAILEGQGWPLRDREQSVRNLMDMDALNANAE
jgi:hypothetical protein